MRRPSRYRRPGVESLAARGMLFVETSPKCLATIEPNQPSGLTATAVSSSQIDLAWTADSTSPPNQATYYGVERSPDGLSGWTSVGTPSTNSFSNTGLTASTQYYYRVIAYNCYGGSLPSASDNATTQSGALTPAWSIDWSTGTPSGYTLTRASSGTYVDSSGYIASAATDVARLTHDSSGSRLGLLVEESRTQHARDTSNWNATLTNNSGTTRTANYAAAPNNQTEATRVEITSSGFIYKGSSGSVSAGTYTFSLWIKATSSGQSVCIRRIFGGSSSVTTVTTSTAWTRYSYQQTLSSSGAVEIGVDQRTVVGGPGSSCDILIWGAQIENGGDVTSYIPNTSTTASVTRSADLAHVLDSSITSWGDPGALVIHFYPPGQAGTLLSTDDASTAQVGLEASSTTAARAFWSSGSTATGTIAAGVNKAVHYWNGSQSKFAINGSLPVSGTNNLTIGNTDFVTLGAEATDSSGVPGTFSQWANCVIRKVEFYSGTLTDANLQTITT